MNDLGRAFILSLTVVTICFGAIAAETSPHDVAVKFYSVVVREHPDGLPDPRVMRLLRPYLSQSLRSMFSRAKKQQAEHLRLHPDEKPPWVDGCLFSCSFDGLMRFRVGKIKVTGRFAYVAVEQSLEPDDSTWTDTLVLARENKRWRIWDVRMGCTWPFRMGPTLRKMLSDN